MKEEVRYHLLRPVEILKRRKECSVAYLPIGTIEWHGPHLPTGSDTLQSENMANLCAERGGGLAFPPLYFGEPRMSDLMEGIDPEIAKEMELPFENFTDESLYPCSPWEEQRHYQLLLQRILCQIETLGFDLVVIVVGHYPLIDHAKSAVLEFNHRPINKNKSHKNRMLAWSCIDLIAIEKYPDVAGDHAAGWETSHVMATHPNRVDLSILPPKGEKIIGVGGRMAPQDASAIFGRETMDCAIDLCLKEVKHRLKNPNIYKGHGCSYLEKQYLEPTRKGFDS